MTEGLKLTIADLNDLSASEIAKLVEECRDPDHTASIEAEVVLTHRTRRAILDAIRPYAATMGTVTAAHLLLDCALATGHKDAVGSTAEDDREV